MDTSTEIEILRSQLIFLKENAELLQQYINDLSKENASQKETIVILRDQLDKKNNRILKILEKHEKTINLLEETNNSFERTNNLLIKANDDLKYYVRLVENYIII